MKKTLLGLLLLLACALPFLSGINGPFFLDDEINLLRARAPTGQLTDIVDAIVRNGSGLLRRPISNATFLLNYHLIGSSAFHYKAVNLLIHLINGLLVWALASRLLRLFRPALEHQQTHNIGLLTAALWLVHPIQVSTVLYSVQRMTQLSALFVFAAMLASLAALRGMHESTSPRTALLRVTGVGLLALLALLSKENGALFPLLLAAVLFCAPRELSSRWWQLRASRDFIVLTTLAPLVIGLVALAIMWPSLLASYEIRTFTLLERLLTQPFVLGHYLYTIGTADITAMGLYLDDFQVRRVNDPLAWVGVAAIAAVCAVAAGVRHRAPILAFAILWYLTAHAMESSFIALEIAFEHRNHVALLGPLLATAYYAHVTLQRLPARTMALLALIPIALLAGLTARRAHQWSHSDLFTVHEVQNHPSSSRALTQAAARDIARGEPDSAVQKLRQAQAARPNSFWMKAYELHLACVGVDSNIDWNALLEQAARRPNELGIEESLKPVARNFQQGTCEALDIERFDAFLVDLLESLDGKSRPQTLERIHILRHTLAMAKGNETLGRAHLVRATEANPSGIEALELLAYSDLNAGRVSDAEQHAGELERRIIRHHRSTLLFKVNELRGFISDAAHSSAPDPTP